MGNVSRSTVKTYFNTGDKPTEAQFVDWIDSGAAYFASYQDLLDKSSTGNADGQIFIVSEFSSGIGGGGIFEWNASQPKSNHNGGTVINPDHNSSPGSPGWYSSTGGSTDDSGSGCYVRRSEQSSFIDASWFGMSPSSTAAQNADALQSCIDYLDTEFGGGIVQMPAGLMEIDTTIVNKRNVTVRGVGVSVFGTATQIKYTGAGTEAFKYSPTTRASYSWYKDFRIQEDPGDPNYQTYTGILVNGNEFGGIEKVTCRGLQKGIHTKADDFPIFGFYIEKFNAIDNLEEGVLFDVGANFANAITIHPSNITTNDIGIYAKGGIGNTIIGNGAEVGANNSKGIQLDDGQWMISGSLWIEQQSVGIEINGGNHTIEGYTKNEDDIIVNNGTLIQNGRSIDTDYLPLSFSNQNLSYYFSFREQQGEYSYDLTKGLVCDINSTSKWERSGPFNSSVIGGSGNIVFPNTVDFSSDWTICLLGYSETTNNELFTVIDGTATRSMQIKSYSAGIQVTLNQDSFTTFNLGIKLNRADEIFNWLILSYDSSSGTFQGHHPTGFISESENTALDSEFSSISNVLGPTEAEAHLDEVLVYERILNAEEIQTITGFRTTPNFQDKSVGTTSQRPANPYQGQPHFDTTLLQPIWYDGTNWIDATGSTV